MITDSAAAAAAAVLEERGWERDEEMVEDVRAALEAAQAELVAAALAEEKRPLARERARRQAEDKRQGRWRHVRPRPAPAEAQGSVGGPLSARGRGGRRAPAVPSGAGAADRDAPLPGPPGS